MGVQLKLTNTEINDKGKAINHMVSGDTGDISVEMNYVEIMGEAELLNEITNAQADEIIRKIVEQAVLLEQTEREYEEIQSLLTEIRERKVTVREIMRRQLPNFVIGVLANVIGGMTRVD